MVGGPIVAEVSFSHRRARSGGRHVAPAFLLTALVTGVLLGSFLILPPRVSAGSWTDTSQQDFLKGSMTNVVATPEGTLRLAPNGTVFGKAGIVVPTGPPGSADSVYARAPFVLREADGTYKMWYSGQDAEPRNRILYATSSDGVNWTKHGVIFDVLTPPYYWDSVDGQSVLKIGSVYHMWFAAGYWSGGPFTFWAQIYHATSTDGSTWDITGVALPPNQPWDIGMTSSPWVVQDASGLFWLFFSGWDGTNTRIGVATSTNGTYFTPYAGNPIVDLGPSGGWDSGDTNTPAVIRGSSWVMYFAGTDRVNESLGLATSNDGFNWTKSPGNPVYGPDPAPAFDSKSLFSPMPLNNLSGFRLYYSGGDGWTIQVGLMLNVTAYETQGTYVSRIFDSGSRLTTWQSIHENASVPSRTVLSSAVRSGDTSTPDSSWSGWDTADASGVPQSGLRGRYAQYRLNLSSPNRVGTPTVDSVTVTYALDQGPTATALQPAGPNWVATPTLRWNSSDPEGDLQMAFEVQLSRDASFATIQATSGPTNSSANEWMPAGLSDGTWYWRIRLSDGVAWGSWVVSSFRLDSTPPALSVLVPSSGSVIPVSRIPVIWTASDAYSGVDHIELRLDGGSAVVLPATVSFYSFPAVADGPHVVVVQAVDAVGNTASQTVAVRVDTVKPTVRFTSPSPDATLTSSRVSLTWQADGTGSAIAGYRLRLDNGNPINVSGDQTSYLLLNVPDGDHIVEITAIDEAGNAATTTLIFRVETNVFSLNGPVGPWVDIGLVVVAAACIAAFFAVRRIRRSGVRKGPPPGT
jgi:Glycosyl hydrolases family 32 N-terminal domain